MPAPLRRAGAWLRRAIGWVVVRQEADRVIDFLSEPAYEGFAHVQRSLRDLRPDRPAAPPGDPVVALGVQGAQTASSVGRGLNRYVTDQARALASLRPEAVAQVSYDPALPRPGWLQQLGPGIEVAPAARPPRREGPLVYHVMSPFEFLVLDRVWPAWAQAPSVALVVTLHDLIPLGHPESYLAERHARHWYLPRLELVRGADAVVAISESAADEAVRLLGLPRERIFVSHEDCGPVFAPPAGGGEGAQARARAALPALRPDFLLYVGGIDRRKNVDGLLHAYAGLGAQVRGRHQLVLAGRHEPHEARALRALLAETGTGGDVLLAGHVSDELLADLYGCCAALVMPSLYEGFGLPVLEAMRCGAAVLVSDRGALPELVTWPEARFDPERPDELQALLGRVLGDLSFRAARREQAAAGSERFSWERSCAKVAEAHCYAVERRRRH